MSQPTDATKKEPKKVALAGSFDPKTGEWIEPLAPRNASKPSLSEADLKVWEAQHSVAQRQLPFPESVRFNLRRSSALTQEDIDAINATRVGPLDEKPKDNGAKP